MIETTAEHPFFVLDRGWVAAVELQPGDRVMGLDHDWINVDAVTTTEHLSKVYNLRVEQDHTYFVGDLNWNFAVWVHNDYKHVQRADNPNIYDVFDTDIKDAAGKPAHVGTLQKRADGKYDYTSNNNSNSNGVFDSPDAAVQKFREEKAAKAAKTAAGSGNAGLENGPKVEGDGVKTGDAPKNGSPKIQYLFGLPSRRHTLTRVSQNTLAKDMNSVIEPYINVADDVNIINRGDAIKVGETFIVNGRTYGYHDNALFPISGPRIHQLNRPAFKALGVFNDFGDTPRAMQILNSMAKTNKSLDKAAIDAGLNAYRAGRR